MLLYYTTQYNNGGYGHPEDKAIHQGGSVESLDAMYRVFLRATYVLVQECLPELEKSKGNVNFCRAMITRYEFAEELFSIIVKLIPT